MGNRAVITTRENFDNNGIGIYLHWNGGKDSVQAFLKYCEVKGYRAPSTDSYGWSYLCGVITNFFGDGLSCGVDTLNNLNCDNWDNGTYIIDGWKIIDRKYYDGEEQMEYDMYDMIKAIDDKMPEHMKLTDGEWVQVEQDCIRTKSLLSPTVSEDCVSVVRCKDCKHRQEGVGMGDHCWCDIANGSRHSDDFCSYGERKDNEIQNTP